MKCDDFLPAIENGGPLRKWRARSHAAQCARCAAVREGWLETRRQWANPAATTTHQRQLWASAVPSERPVTSSGVWSARRWAFAAAASVLIVVGLSASLWRPSPEVAEVAPPPAPALNVAELEQAKLGGDSSFEVIEQALNQLEVELEVLALDAALLDARSEVELLLTTYKPLSVSQVSN